MRFKKSANPALDNAIIEFNVLNVEGSRSDLISQTSILFDSPLCVEHFNEIRLGVIAWLQLTNIATPLKDVIQAFNKNQSDLINICLSEIITILKGLPNAKDSALSTSLSNLVNFTNNKIDIDTLFISQQAKEAIKKLYPSVKCRLLIKITDVVEKFFLMSGGSIGMLEDSNTEKTLVMEVDSLVSFLGANKGRRIQLKLAFERDLLLHEKSSLLKGIIFKSQSDLESIFKVYNTALKNKREIDVDLSVQFLSLWMGLLDNMVIISSSLRDDFSSPITVTVEPVTENVSYTRTTTLGISESQIQYSLTIKHKVATTELHSLAASARAVPTTKAIIYLSESLNPVLAMAFDAHAQKIKESIGSGYIHKDRRNSKYAALSKMLEASKKSELTPEKFYESCTDKPTLFSSCGTSKTKDLFNEAKNQQKEQMWSKTAAMNRSNSEPPTGFFIRNAGLSKKLEEKYKSFLDPAEKGLSPEYPDDQDMAVRNALDEDGQKTFDKKKSLAWLTKANQEGNLHPCQFRLIEESFPMRNSCFWLWGSKVERIIEEVKQDLSESLWIYSGGEGPIEKASLLRDFEAKRTAVVSPSIK